MTKQFAAIAASMALISQVSLAQTVILPQADQQEEQASTEPVQELVVLPRDTPVHLMVVNEVSSKESRAGDRFELRVMENVISDDQIVVSEGAKAWGEVASSESSGNIGKSGRLEVSLLYIEAGAIRIPITGHTSDRGKSGTAETVMGVLSLGLLGFFAKGNNAKIKAGEQMTAFTSADVQVPKDLLS